MMMLTESVIHREELLLVSDQDVCAPPENEIRMVIFAKKIHIYINSCASQNMGSKLVAIANGSASASASASAIIYNKKENLQGEPKKMSHSVL